MELIKFIKDVKNFPSRGIIFKDISPLLANGEALHYTINELAKLAEDADIIVGPDARGFLFGTPVAAKLKKPFIMVRKAGKLPGEVISKHYALEYGKNILEIQKGFVHPGQKAVVIDDVLATGGTLNAIVDLLESQGVIVIRVLVLMELLFLDGRSQLKTEVKSLIKVE